MFVAFLAVLADIPHGEFSKDGSFLDVYIFSTDPNGRPIERPFGSVRCVDRQASYLREQEYFTYQVNGLDWIFADALIRRSARNL